MRIDKVASIPVSGNINWLNFFYYSRASDSLPPLANNFLRDTYVEDGVDYEFSYLTNSLNVRVPPAPEPVVVASPVIVETESVVTKKTLGFGFALVVLLALIIFGRGK